MSRRIEDLSENARTYARAFTAKLSADGIPYTIIETRRSPLVQAAYYSRGREDHEKICAKYHKAGLAAPSEAEARKIITRTLRSRHIEGDALDVAPLTAHGTIPWNISSQEIADLWMRIGIVGESVGLLWGGRWTPLDHFGIGWDAPHFEVP